VRIDLHSLSASSPGRLRLVRVPGAVQCARRVILSCKMGHDSYVNPLHVFTGMSSGVTANSRGPQTQQRSNMRGKQSKMGMVIINAAEPAIFSLFEEGAIQTEPPSAESPGRRNREKRSSLVAGNLLHMSA